MKKQTKPDKTLAVVGLVLNIIILPGLGTIIAGNTKTGVIQLILYAVGFLLFLVGIPFLFLLIGIPMMLVGGLLMFGIWIWAIVSGIRLVQQAES